MSTYVGKLLTSISSALEFNTATLSGAIDIIVIEDDTGRRQCSPFHVRFGKLQLLKSRGIPVNVELNGCPTNLRMLLGAAGEAYFYRRSQLQSTPDDQNINRSVSTNSSPTSVASVVLDSHSRQERDKRAELSSSSSLLEEAAFLRHGHSTQTSNFDFDSQHQDHSSPSFPADYSFAYVSDSEVELTRKERDGTSEVVDEPRSPPVNSSQRKWSSVVVQNHNFAPTPETKLVTATCITEASENLDCLESRLDGLTSEGSFAISKRTANRSSVLRAHQQGTPASEETDVGNSFEAAVTVSNSITDVVGEEDAKIECRSIDGQDIEDSFEDLQQRVVGALSQSKPSTLRDSNFEVCVASSEQNNSEDYRTSVRRYFLESLHLPYEEVTDAARKEGLLSMSNCGRLLSADMREDEILELFERHKVSFSEFEKKPDLLFDPSLVVRIENRLVEFRVAAACIFSVLCFQGKVDIDTWARLLAKERKDEPVKSPPTPSRRFRWFGWSSPTIEGEPLLQQDDLDVLDAIPTSKSENASRDHMSMNLEGPVDLDHPQQPESDGAENSYKEDHREDPNEVQRQGPDTSHTAEDVVAASASQPPLHEPKDSVGVCFSELDPETLSLYPSEEELMQLDLKPGANEVRFIVQSSSVELSCRIFLWSCHTKIFISDVDGTITRSDVLGHLLPAVGRDWSQVGVAGLYSQIEKNGYQVLYLTARPIGQASQTRSFLHNVSQGSAKLPNGPVLMSPNRLVESFTREVIHRKPHEFKITALREIRSLFPPDYNPFHAGFGNRDSDVISYRAVGLIPQRIFVVNPKGELVVTKARYESTASYSTLQDLVESVFPDISRQSDLDKVQAVTESATFNDWNFWRGSLPEVDLDSLLQTGTVGLP